MPKPKKIEWTFTLTLFFPLLFLVWYRSYKIIIIINITIIVIINSFSFFFKDKYLMWYEKDLVPGWLLIPVLIFCFFCHCLLTRMDSFKDKFSARSQNLMRGFEYYLGALHYWRNFSVSPSLLQIVLNLSRHTNIYFTT